MLFVWAHNAGRSQMAAALLRHRAASRVVVPSADTHPASDPVVPGRRNAD
ncbi:hypothetical protein ACIOKD_30885 [Streptomyces sp. NPDC087844]